MKKNMVLMVILIVYANTVAFSNDNRLSLGFEYGNFFEKRTDGGIDIETYKGSGINFSAYHLWNNFGFFHNHSFLFPNNITSNRDGYDYFFQYNFIIGPAFKIAFGEKIDITFGGGFSMGPTIGELHTRSLSQFNMGIGGDIGVSFFVNKMFYVNIGSIITYHFANITSTGTGTYDDEGDENKETEWSRNYTMAGIRPYIRIGIALNRK